MSIIQTRLINLTDHSCRVTGYLKGEKLRGFTTQMYKNLCYTTYLTNGYYMPKTTFGKVNLPRNGEKSRILNDL